MCDILYVLRPGQLCGNRDVIAMLWSTPQGSIILDCGCISIVPMKHLEKNGKCRIIFYIVRTQCENEIGHLL